MASGVDGAALTAGDDAPVIRHRRRGKGIWCGGEKADHERYATKWDDTTCPSCIAAKDSQESAPAPPAPAEWEKPGDVHHHFGSLAGNGAKYVINRALDNRGREQLPPDADPALLEWGVAAAFLADSYGLLDAVAGPWALFGVATAKLGMIAIGTGEKDTKNGLSDPSGQDGGRPAGEREDVLLPADSPAPAQGVVA